MVETRISSRLFNQETSAAKRAAAKGPVIITERGRDAHVLLTFEAYEALVGTDKSLDELLYMPGLADIDLELPPRDDLGRAADLF